MTPASVSLPGKLHNDPWICQLFICKDIAYWNCVSRVSMRPTAKTRMRTSRWNFLEVFLFAECNRESDQDSRDPRKDWQERQGNERAKCCRRIFERQEWAIPRRSHVTRSID